jgi:NAD(P)-dependent dehydrogenase (short-subunit alcohol dehydrogenase family)
MRDMSRGSLSPQSMAAASVGTTIRVLVIGTDARYRERAHTVIGELGSVVFAVAEPSDPDDVAVLAQRERADVVVLDATDCEAAVAHVVATLAAKAPRLGLVVVCEHLTGAARALNALPKWGWRSELSAAVQHARIDGSPLARSRERWAAERRDLRGVAPAPASRR